MKRLLLSGLAMLAGLTIPAQAKVDPAAVAAVPIEVASVPVSLLFDLGSGRVLYSREPDRRFAPASMTKVMTAYVAFGQMAAGTLRPEQSFKVTPDQARAWSGQGTSLFLKGGQTVSAETLLRGITTVSANDASIVLAEGQAGSVPVWTALMNAAARRLEMADSHFATPNGWPDQGATYVSARDLVRLADALTGRHAALYRSYFGQKQFEFGGVNQFNKDPTLGVVVGADGIKTGHTDEAGYNFLGSAERAGRRLVLVIGGAKSEAERARAARAMFEWGFTAWQSQQLFATGQQIGTAKVQDGDVRAVGLVAARPVLATVPNNSPLRPEAMRITYQGPLVAPIRKGARVAMLELDFGNGGKGLVPLYAAQSVGTAGPIDRLLNGLAGLFS